MQGRTHLADETHIETWRWLLGPGEAHWVDRSQCFLCLEARTPFSLSQSSRQRLTVDPWPLASAKANE